MSGSEFPTDWHRERYIEDLEREVVGAERRLAELKELANVSQNVLDEAKSFVTNATAELARARATKPVKQKETKKGDALKKPGASKPAES